MAKFATNTIPNLKASITGIREIDRALSKLGPKIAKKILRSSMRKGMKTILSDIKDHTPVRTGQLKKEIKIRPPEKRSRNWIGLDIRSQDDNFKVKFLEFGTQNMTPRPFFRPAYDRHSQPVKEQVLQEIKEIIDKENNKK